MHHYLSVHRVLNLSEREVRECNNTLPKVHSALIDKLQQHVNA